MLLSTIFQLYRGSQFYWWRKPEYREKTTRENDHLSQITDKLDEHRLHQVPVHLSKVGIILSLQIVGVIGTDCRGVHPIICIIQIVGVIGTDCRGVHPIICIIQIVGVIGTDC